jgi:hypothetical protein
MLAWLRLRSRSLVAPILPHAATNVSAYLAGLCLARGRERTGPPSRPAQAGRPDPAGTTCTGMPLRTALPDSSS